MVSGCDTIVEKVWGREFWLANSAKYCMKVLWVTPGQTSSLHCHRVKDETFLCVFGECYLQVGRRVRKLSVGMWAHIQPGEFHRFWVPPDTHGMCGIVECSTQHFESDVERRTKSRRISKKQHEIWKEQSDVPVS